VTFENVMCLPYIITPLGKMMTTESYTHPFHRPLPLPSLPPGGSPSSLSPFPPLFFDHCVLFLPALFLPANLGF
jgi:hypothetical protein